MRLNATIADADFVYYYLSQASSIEKIIRDSEHTGVPKINLGYIKKFPIVLPSLAIQKSIVAMLRALDDRIVLLQETNSTLEGISQALFKSWFVDFDPVRAKQHGLKPEGMDEAMAALFPDGFVESEQGMVPAGWQASTLEDVSSVGIGKTPPRKEQQWFSENPDDVSWVSIRDMGVSGAFISHTNEYLTAESIQRFNVRQVPNNTVLLSFKMTIGRVALTDGEMTTNEAIAHFKINEHSPLTSEFIYLHLKQFDYSTLSSTSSIADAVNSKTVKGIPILVPDAAVLQAFQGVVSDIFSRIKLVQQHAQTLTTLRDTLLPRLISGQLRLPDDNLVKSKAILEAVA
jgi:type I restriction enzyme S subunit